VPRDLRSRCTQSHAKTDIARALREYLRQHAIDSDRG